MRRATEMRPSRKSLKNAGFESPDFRGPHKQRATEIDPHETPINSGFEKSGISVAHSIYSPPRDRHENAQAGQSDTAESEDAPTFHEGDF